MKNTNDKEANIAYRMGYSWREQIMAICAGILLVLVLLWITMPSESERLINKTCFKKCKIEVEREGHTMSFLSARSYIDAIKTCHTECSSVIR